jgi:tetratricopeptide (TPR) repeat protein
MARGHTTKASALFSQVVDVAQRAGVLQPLLLGWVGMLQCAVASGDLDTARSLRKLLEDSLSSDTGICTVGVSVVSAAQNMGDAQRAIALAEKCERFFRGRGLSASEAHALSILGTCFAAAGKWSQAKKVWSRAVALEDERRALISASDKRAALAQAIAMVEYTERGYIAEKVGVQVHELLQEAEECLSLFEGVSAALRAKAKVLSIRAQLCVIAKDSVAAVSHLHKARGIYEGLQSPRDVALTDALTGLALMEVGKTKGGELYEEAHVMLQQAHHFFDAPQHNAIRWKLKYYLSISAYLSSQTRGHGDAGSSWRETSATWLRRAMDDVEDLRDEDQLGADAQEFSPGLQPEVLEPLKKALGIKARAAASRRARAAEQLADDGGYVH